MLLVAALFSCNHKHDVSDGHGVQFVEVELNEGQKWDANPETTQGIRNIQAQIAGAGSESLDYPALAEALEKEYKDIIKNCTMKGEAHRQLHHYLAPVHHYLQQIKSEDQEEAHEALSALKAHIEKYDVYFK